MYALANDESLVALAHETPPNALARLYDRHTTRVYMRKSAFVFSGSTGTRLTSGRPRYPHNVLRCYFFILISLIYGFKGRDATRPAYYAPEGKPNADDRIRVR